MTTIDLNSYICYNWMPMLSDHVLDMTEEYYNSIGVTQLHNKENFHPEDVNDGDVIFVKTDYIYHPYFQHEILPNIKNKFTLITGGSSYHIGSNGDTSYREIIQSPNLIKWLCTNPPSGNRDKIIPLPIGFEERERVGGNQQLIHSHRLNRTPFQDKKEKILLPHHTFNTNPERKDLFVYLSKLPFVETQTEKLPWTDYMKLIDEYKFVLCLEGSGPDVHRNYECLLVDCVPINLKNPIHFLFEYHKLAGVFLGGWEDLRGDVFNQINSVKYNQENSDSFLKIKYHNNILRGLE